MSRPGRAAAGCALAVAVVFYATSLSAHPLSTFGVRLHVSGDTVTAILNADAAPLLGKLDALAPRPSDAGDTLERIRQHLDLIRSLSFVMAGSTRVAMTPGAVRTNADGQVEI